MRISFWLGGQDSEPVGTTPDRPVWSGRITDISAGGFQTLVTSDVAMAIDLGDTVGLRITFGAGEEVESAGVGLEDLAAELLVFRGVQAGVVPDEPRRVAPGGAQQLEVLDEVGDLQLGQAVLTRAEDLARAPQTPHSHSE